jgi:hypothetical protein
VSVIVGAALGQSKVAHYPFGGLWEVSDLVNLLVEAKESKKAA